MWPSRIRVLCPFSIAAVIFFAAAILPAQNPPVKSYTLSKVKVVGSKRFTEAQITVAAGLRLGQSLDVKGLDAAAARLYQSGALSKVRYSFNFNAESLIVEFQVTDASQFVPCTYDNFVWFQDSDLNAAVQKTVPLYDGNVPEGGDMTQQVTSALENFIHAHKIPGTVVATPTSAGIGAKISGFGLSISDISIPIKNVEITGGPLDAQALANATRPLRLANYSRSFVRNVAATGMTEAYQDQGYLQARFSEPRITLKDLQASDASQGVAVMFTVTPGPLYNWNGVEWDGNQSIVPSELTGLVGMNNGEIARRDKTLEGWAAVRKAYDKIGHITAFLRPTPQFDAAQHLVHYQVLVQEGPEYSMGEFLVTGVPEPLATKIQKAWKLKPGQVYDGTYQMTFLRQDLPNAMKSVTGLRPGIQPEMLASVNNQTHVVNLEIKFR